VKAITEQAQKGLHYSAGSELELRWAELVRSIVPGAERVRFTLTGTETTSLAVRVARAFTGRDYIIKFESHFHGVHDLFVGRREGSRSRFRPRPASRPARSRPRWSRAATTSPTCASCSTSTRSRRSSWSRPAALHDGADESRVPEGAARRDEEGAASC
jgi:glutamate-1-semialdehyde aminotransferase